MTVLEDQLAKDFADALIADGVLDAHEVTDTNFPCDIVDNVLSTSSRVLTVGGVTMIVARYDTRYGQYSDTEQFMVFSLTPVNDDGEEDESNRRFIRCDFSYSSWGGVDTSLSSVYEVQTFPVTVVNYRRVINLEELL